MSELVSVVMPVYNAELYIKQAIESVIKQSYACWELLIIDDCSKDHSSQIIRGYLDDKKIKYVKLNKNQGVSNARNIGIEMSKGRFIAFLDSDDFWDPQKLEKQINYMINKSSNFSCTELTLIDNDGNLIKNITNYSDIIKYNTLLYDNQIACSSVIISKSLLKHRHFKEVRHEDLALWLEITKEEFAVCLKESLLFYRKIDTSLSSDKTKSAKWRWQIYRDVEKMPLYKCIYFFIIYAFNGVLKHHL